MDQEIFLEEKGPRQTWGQSDEVRGGVGSCWYLDTEKNQESQTQTKKPQESYSCKPRRRLPDKSQGLW